MFELYNYKELDGYLDCLDGRPNFENGWTECRFFLSKGKVVALDYEDSTLDVLKNEKFGSEDWNRLQTFIQYNQNCFINKLEFDTFFGVFKYNMSVSWCKKTLKMCGDFKVVVDEFKLTILGTFKDEYKCVLLDISPTPYLPFNVDYEEWFLQCSTFRCCVSKRVTCLPFYELGLCLRDIKYRSNYFSLQFRFHYSIIEVVVLYSSDSVYDMIVRVMNTAGDIQAEELLCAESVSEKVFGGI